MIILLFILCVCNNNLCLVISVCVCDHNYNSDHLCNTIVVFTIIIIIILIMIPCELCGKDADSFGHHGLSFNQIKSRSHG